MAGTKKNTLLILIIQPAAKMGAFSGNSPWPCFVGKKNKIMFQQEAARRDNLAHLHMTRLLRGAVGKKTENRVKKQRSCQPAQPSPSCGQQGAAGRISAIAGCICHGTRTVMGGKHGRVLKIRFPAFPQGKAGKRQNSRFTMAKETTTPRDTGPAVFRKHDQAPGRSHPHRTWPHP